jgi:steroid delta-isomerase
MQSIVSSLGAMDQPPWVAAFQSGFSAAAESLNLENLDTFAGFYAQDAQFIDPFASLQGVQQIRASYLSMLTNLHGARFVCQDWAQASAGGNNSVRMVITWTFFFRIRPASPEVCIHGASWLEVNSISQRIEFHRDYWDASELLAAFPALGWLIRGVKKRVAAAGHVMEKS